MSLFSLKRKNYHIPLEIQRQQWFRNFIVAFMAVFVCYLTVYLLRNNFKAAQTLLIEQNNFSTTELGMIGLAFSVAYGIGKTILGYGIDGKNAKKIMSFLLGVSAIISIIIGILLITKQATTGILFILGFLVFGPQLLIGVSVIEFVPKSALAVTNGLTETFAYLFGDSFAKVFLGYIADPTKSGMNIFGYTLHGWGATFTIIFTALIIAGLMMIPVALKQEMTIRKIS
ncbi:hypothetical protein [Listeria immobilis]|uniref:hypothetical protein n=1 Tax=Listeria immobilis TaxID=2713502 RepID=UPI001629C597|nr:hypothetical protein [Listeria immobilis]MBC1514835.1 hypothetical protein [Listeria immobilis]